MSAKKTVPFVLDQLRRAIFEEVKKHVESLRNAEVEYYGYAVRPPDYLFFSAYNPASIVIAFNREIDIDFANRDSLFYRYSADEWRNIVEGEFERTDETLKELVSHVCLGGNVLNLAIASSVYQAILDGLLLVRNEGVFESIPFVVLWLQSDVEIVLQSAKLLNSPEIYSEFAKEFSD